MSKALLRSFRDVKSNTLNEDFNNEEATENQNDKSHLPGE